MNIVIPLAGKDKQFDIPKPLFEIEGIPIIQMIAKSRPYSFSNAIFILLREHEKYKMSEKLKEIFGEDIKIVWAEKITSGAPQSVLLASKYINNNDELIIDLADQQLDLKGFMDFIKNTDSDGVIPTFESKYPNRGYMIYNENGNISKISEKDKIPISTHSTACISYFKKGKDYVKYAKKMIDEDMRAANGAYLLSLTYNQMINDKKRIIGFDCDFVGTMGTIDGARGFEQYDRPLISNPEIVANKIINTKVMAHRGLGFGENENTIKAITRSLEHGFGCEIDLQTTKDGKLVISHDENVENVLGINKLIIDMDLSELQEKIPTFDDVIDIVAKTEKGVLAIHVKNDHTLEKLDEIVRCLLQKKIENRVVLFADNYRSRASEDLVMRTKKICKYIATGLHITIDKKELKLKNTSADILWIDYRIGAGNFIKNLQIILENKKPSILMSLELLEKNITPEKSIKFIKKIGVERSVCLCTDYPKEITAYFL